MFTAYKNFWKQAFKYEGLTSQKDYLWVFLINNIIRVLIIFSGASFIAAAMMEKYTPGMTIDQITEIEAKIMLQNPPLGYTVMTLVGIIYSLIIMIPVTTMTARRIREAGYRPGMAYPLPAIYLGNAAMGLFNIPGLSVLSPFFTIYAIMLFFMAIRKNPITQR